jgi:chemosensory pili system protein ChpE
MRVLTIFSAAFALGLVFNAAPGPVFAATVRWGVRGGFRPALLVQIGSLAGDAVWALLGMAGVGLLAQLESLRLPIAIGGAAYLVWLGWQSWQAGRQEIVDVAPEEDVRSALRSGVLLSLSNPQNIGYWAAIGSAFGAVGVREPDVNSFGAFFAGFMASSVVWSLAFAAVVDWVFGRAGASWARVTYRVCAIVFIGLALASLREQWTSRTASADRPARVIAE